jgi:hypothetical protein
MYASAQSDVNLFNELFFSLRYENPAKRGPAIAFGAVCKMNRCVNQAEENSFPHWLPVCL